MIYKFSNLYSKSSTHPYYNFKGSIGKHLGKLRKYIDAIEYSGYYLPFMNKANYLARKNASKYNLPLVGNSDCYYLDQLGYTYTLVDAKRNRKSIAAALKQGKTKIKSRSLPFLVSLGFTFNQIRHRLETLRGKAL